MFTIIEFDSYSYDRVILRDDICIFGSFEDTKKVLKQQLRQIKKDYEKKIESIEENEDFFTILFKENEAEFNYRHMFTAQIIKVTM